MLVAPLNASLGPSTQWIAAAPGAYPPVRMVTMSGRGVERMRRVAENVLLPVWFAILGPGYLALVIGPGALGVDARIYYRGVAAWLAGGDPWSAVASYDVSYGTNYYHYAGLPTTTVLMAPATLLPEAAFVGAWLLLGAASAIFIVRRLGLPIWWLMFPPLLEGTWSGNPGIVLMALLVASHPILDGIAVGLKVYALVPLVLLGRIRGVVVGLAVVAVSVLVAPGLWSAYIDRFGEISARLASESAGGYSAWGTPLLIPVAGLLGVLALLDRKTAAWLVVPALWPSSELHYSVLALPVASPLLAALLAVPTHGILPVAIGAFAAIRIAVILRARRGSPVSEAWRAIDGPIERRPGQWALDPAGAAPP